jgi:prophage DNA circulation protein
LSTPAELVAAMQALVAAVGDTASDPADRVRLMAAMAVAEAPQGGDGALAAVARRAALAALARAAAAYAPASYDEALALRSTVCGLLADEEVIAADAGEDTVAAALRDLRGAVYRDLTARGASLSPLRQVTLAASLPAEVLAQRLYGDAGRADELVEMAGDPPNPVFMPTSFKGMAR